MLKILIKNSLRAFFEPFKPKTDKNGKKKLGRPILYVILYLYIALSYAAMYYESFSETSLIYEKLNFAWLFYSIASISAAQLTIFISMLTSEQYLYEAKDNDLLLSLPIKKEYLLLARSAPLVVLGLATSLITMLPALIVWCINVEVNMQMIISFIITFPFYSLVLIVIGSIFGLIINLISKKIGSKVAIKVIVSILIFVLFEVVSIKLESAVFSSIRYVDTVTAILKVFFPVYLYGKAIGEGSILALITYVLISMLIIGVCFIVLAKTYIPTITKTYNFKLKKYKEKRSEQTSSDYALLVREIKRLTRTFSYLLNSCFSSIMLIVMMVILMFKFNDINELLVLLVGEDYQTYAGVIVTAVICLLLSTSLISACSVSLEGKNIWISHVLPVETSSILLSKVFAQIIFTTPIALLLSVELIIFIKPSVLVAMNMILIPFAYSILIAILGVIINIQLPKLDWTNEIVVIKQAGAVFVAMSVNLLYIALPSLLYAFVLYDKIKIDKYATVFMLFTFVAIFLSYKVLISETAKKYERLG